MHRVRMARRNIFQPGGGETGSTGLRIFYMMIERNRKRQYTLFSRLNDREQPSPPHVVALVYPIGLRRVGELYQRETKMNSCDCPVDDGWDFELGLSPCLQLFSGMFAYLPPFLVNLFAIFWVDISDIVPCMFCVDISKVVLSDPRLLHRVGRPAPSLKHSLSSIWF